MANNDIKSAAKSAGIPLWQVAEAMGIQDSNFSRMLRHELPECRKEDVLTIISGLSQKEDTGIV